MSIIKIRLDQCLLLTIVIDYDEHLQCFLELRVKSMAVSPATSTWLISLFISRNKICKTKRMKSKCL